MAEHGGSDNLAIRTGQAETTADPARRVFISYASHDAAVAQNVCSALEGAGFPCWMAPRDEDLYVIKGDPLFKNLEGDPRLNTILRKMNLPE